ncbi:DUF4124 domain-containing protein [Ectothiorhodospira variabilis]|uniref:DUF4124 domain-containing protein n=1 Tax=Ectothiorhodospira variabilis TaxID=505694 RepID=UPI001EFAA346|nr:DUF4124 domain-containing protein [Ectothiorhodospira variabilis]MCG5494414.1 DUF4124 domain-containing protein [Ectothiorhodospira variabilis]MCG5503215.1 DUF4124 domain-containing protein [Ectothiorhodospira variabilis]MCG5506026.1 DUF4124 domain-containing protein [Ectothiorhodospira variabilis]
MHFRKVFAASLALALVAASAQGQVYRWTDEDGNVHFGDAPPGAGTERLQPQTAPVDPTEVQRRRLETQRQLQEFERQDREAARQRELQQRRRALQQRFDEIDARSDQRMCQFYQDRIEDARNEMRRGYSAQRGRVLRQRIERDQREASRYCR